MEAIKGKRVAVCGPLPEFGGPLFHVFAGRGCNLTVTFHDHHPEFEADIRYALYQAPFKAPIPPVALFLDESVSQQSDSRYHALRALPQAHGYFFAVGGKLPDEPEPNRHHVAIIDGKAELVFQYLPLTGVFAIFHLLHLGAAEVYATGMDFYGGKHEFIGRHWIPPQIADLRRLLETEPRFSCDERLKAILHQSA